VLASGGYAPETETVLSDNLLDKSLMTKGQVFYYGGSKYQLAASTYSYYGFVPLRGAGTYRTKFQQQVHESTGTRIALVNDNNTWVANTTGTCGEIVEDKNWVDFEFVVTQEHISAGATKVAFDVYSGANDGLFNQTMIVKDREYPSEFIPFGYIEVATDSGRKQNNVLCEKTAVFLGDSICAGTTVGTDSPYYNYGWGGIIGEANRMNWKNYGKNGGTITHRGADGTCIAKIADTAIAEHPNADYVIFEGGCNDADQMRDAGLGEISADYATFDTTTFSGALEALILKLVTAYPHAKIGYIIPQKMYKGYADFTAKNHIHRKYFDRAVEICQKWGIPVVDIWNGSMLNPKLSTASVYYSDGIQHLSEAGYLAITPMIEAWMRNMYTPGAAADGSGGVTSWNDLTDKPFDIVEVMPETQFVYDESLGVFAGQSSLYLVPGRKYIVNWNGVEYTTTARFGVFSRDENKALVNMVGNPVTVGGEDNGLPFALAKMLPYGGGSIGAIPLDGSTSVTVSIKSSTFYETSDTLMLETRWIPYTDPATGGTSNKLDAIYATPEQIAQAFFAGKRIVAINYSLGLVQMVLTMYLPGAATTDGSDIISFHVPNIGNFSFYQMKYNGDGTYVPYVD
jgi:lysophospholipase L1-like esterase